MEEIPAASRVGASAPARAALRRELRGRRAALTPAMRLEAARAITAHLAGSGWLRAGRAIGLYIAVDAEVDTTALRGLAARRRCIVYMPRIDHYRLRRMSFRRDAGPRAVNRHGIPEPVGPVRRAPRCLSVVFVPLLGFDRRGYRLGSGAGYYDRLFQYRHRDDCCHRPLLVGLGYACQRLDRIDNQPHDVRLDAVVTEEGLFRCR